MRYTLDSYIIWEFGKRTDDRGNPHQEDCIWPDRGGHNVENRLFVLCDGMGGHDSGEVASAAVCEAFAANAQGSDAQGVFTDRMLADALSAAFDALDRRDTGAAKKMGTTMTFLRFHAAGATVAHIGDSRVYHIRPGKDADRTEILHVTSDHSLVNDLVRIGEMTPEEAAVSPRRNVLTRAMQPHQPQRCRADVKHITDIRPGDYFYMCSDGMLEQMTDDNIRYIFSDAGGSPEHKIEVLKRATADNSDNHTAIVVRVDTVEGTPVAEPIPSAATTGKHEAASPGQSSNAMIFIGAICAIAIAVAVWLFVRTSDAVDNAAKDGGRKEQVDKSGKVKQIKHRSVVDTPVPEEQSAHEATPEPTASRNAVRQSAEERNVVREQQKALEKAAEEQKAAAEKKAAEEKAAAEKAATEAAERQPSEPQPQVTP